MLNCEDFYLKEYADGYKARAEVSDTKRNCPILQESNTFQTLTFTLDSNMTLSKIKQKAAPSSNATACNTLAPLDLWSVENPPRRVILMSLSFSSDQ